MDSNICRCFETLFLTWGWKVANGNSLGLFKPQVSLAVLLSSLYSIRTVRCKLFVSVLAQHGVSEFVLSFKQAPTSRIPSLIPQSIR